MEACLNLVIILYGKTLFIPGWGSKKSCCPGKILIVRVFWSNELKMVPMCEGCVEKVHIQISIVLCKRKRRGTG